MPLTGRTKLLTLIAHPVTHVRAPEFFNPLFAARGVDAFLVPLHVRPEDLAAALAALQRMDNVAGCVVTIPHKETVAQLCDALGANAAAAGAANAVRFEPDGRRTGDIFDGTGLLLAMRAAGIAVTGRRVLIVGAGGAARAIAMAFAAERPARLGIANRTPARAERLAADLRRHFAGVAAAAVPVDPAGWELVVNATALGLHDGDPAPVDTARIERGADVVEIIAVRPVTALMEAAAARGCRVLGGRPMAEHQVDAMIGFFRLSAAP